MELNMQKFMDKIKSPIHIEQHLDGRCVIPYKQIVYE